MHPDDAGVALEARGERLRTALDEDRIEASGELEVGARGYAREAGEEEKVLRRRVRDDEHRALDAAVLDRALAVDGPAALRPLEGQLEAAAASLRFGRA